MTVFAVLASAGADLTSTAPGNDPTNSADVAVSRIPRRDAQAAECRTMEPMMIHVLSVITDGRRARARARAVARDARIALQVTGISKAELWQRARKEVLRYLAPT